MDFFVTTLHTLVENFDYSPLSEQIIQDRLIIVLLNANLSKKLKLEANLKLVDDLKLADAIALARNRESLKSQQSIHLYSTRPENFDVNAFSSRSRCN